MLFVSPRAARFLLDPLSLISILSLPFQDRTSSSLADLIIEAQRTSNPWSALVHGERQFNSPPLVNDIPSVEEGISRSREKYNRISFRFCRSATTIPSSLFTSSSAPTTLLSFHLRVLRPNSAGNRWNRNLFFSRQRRSLATDESRPPPEAGGWL